MKKTLILRLGRKDEDLKSQVYNETQGFIAENLPNTVIHDFTTDSDLFRTVKENEFSTVIYTDAIFQETAAVIRGLGLVQILIGSKDGLADSADVIIDPLLKRSEKFLAGTKYLLPDILKRIKSERIADIMGIDKDMLTEEVSHNDAEDDLISITQLYKKLDWDSGFFGINVGFISCLRLTPNIEKHVRNFIRKEKIDLLEYRCNCHDRESIVTSSANGYLFVDIRLTFEQFLHKNKKVDEKSDYRIEKGVPADIERLKEIATGIYRHSRYCFDINFDRKKVVEFYRNWIEKAIRGTFDDYAYVLYHDNEPIGFCTIKEIRNRAARIGLFGISPQHTGKGLAEYLLNMTLQRLLRETGIRYVEVVTQGRNYAAQRLYQRSGFMTKTTELWYHKWFR